MSDFGETINGNSRNPVRKMWDFPENTSSTVEIFVKVWSKKMKIQGKNYNQKMFLVHRKGTEEEKQAAANVLAHYQHDYEKIIKNMTAATNAGSKMRLSPYQKSQIKLFLSLHSDKLEHRVQEINLDSPYDKFIGMNKPYDIYLADKESEVFIGPNLRQEQESKRVRMLCLGTAINCKNSENIASILGYLRPGRRKLFFNARVPYSKSLLIHELAHTVANHVMFRPNDHHADFYEAERLVKKFLPN